jgi:NAD(P)-dependent dehydrogenase (short-subunit alcohol dehydrogenase family)
MTRVWALELAQYGITVNALCPGWAETDMTLGAAVNEAELFLDAGLSHCAKAGLSMKI